MTMLRELLATWENWSAHDTLTRALDDVTTDDARARLTAALTAMPSTSALAALGDSAELVALLTGWQWQAAYAARRDGASWEQIGAVTGVTAEAARTSFSGVIDRQESILGLDVSRYREVLEG